MLHFHCLIKSLLLNVLLNTFQKKKIDEKNII